MSPEQARAARAHLRYTFQDVEDNTKIKMNSISRFEKENGALTDENNKILKKFYEAEGIEFTNHNGLRIRPKSTILQFDGQAGFIEFMKDVAKTVEKQDGEICVSGVDERLFEKWQGDYADAYLSNMVSLRKKTKINAKIILKEGDHYYTAANYAEYRHINANRFASSSFYVYGDKLAMIVFEENDVTVYIIKNEKLANAQRKQFYTLWDSIEK